MTLWEFAACVDGWNKAQGGEEAAPAMTAEEYDELVIKHAEWLSNTVR